MTANVKIIMELTGEVIADDYPYSLSMSGISGTNPQLFIPTQYAISKQDLQKAGEFKGVSIPTRELVRVLTNKDTVIRATDFAKARGQTQYPNLEQATQSGVIQNNIDLIMSLIFKKGNVLKIQSQDYSVYSSDLKKWTKTSAIPSYQANVSLFLVKGSKVSFRKQQELSCSDKRRKLRSSFKNVLNIDIGEPKGKQFVPKRLIPPQVARSRTSRAYPRFQYPPFGRQYPTGYPMGYPYGRVGQYRQNGGKRNRKSSKRRRSLRRTRKLKQRSKKAI